MLYSSNTDLLDEFSEADLARLSGDSTGTTVDTERTTRARSRADALIDAYLYGRYELPFTEVDPIIKEISIDLTVANLFQYKYGTSSIPETIVWRRINAINLLKDLQKGAAHLSSLEPGTSSPPPILANKTASDRIFDDGVWEEFDKSGS